MGNGCASSLGDRPPLERTTSAPEAQDSAANSSLEPADSTPSHRNRSLTTHKRPNSKSREAKRRMTTSKPPQNFATLTTPSPQQSPMGEASKPMPETGGCLAFDEETKAVVASLAKKLAKTVIEPPTPLTVVQRHELQRSWEQLKTNGQLHWIGYASFLQLVNNHPELHAYLRKYNNRGETSLYDENDIRNHSVHIIKLLDKIVTRQTGDVSGDKVSEEKIFTDVIDFHNDKLPNFAITFMTVLRDPYISVVSNILGTNHNENTLIAHKWLIQYILFRLQEIAKKQKKLTGK